MTTGLTQSYPPPLLLLLLLLLLRLPVELGAISTSNVPLNADAAGRFGALSIDWPPKAVTLNPR